MSPYSRDTFGHERRVSASLVPMDAQLDLDGRQHEIAPQTAQEQLFTPAPAQLAGQTNLDLGNEAERKR